MDKKFQDITWLAGRIFIERDFKDQDLDKLFESCPYGDLADDQKKTFETAFKNPELRAIVEQWWKAYDEARENDLVAKASPWL